MAKAPAQRRLDVIGGAHDDVVFRDRLRYRGDVGFLEAVGAHQMRFDLTRDRDQRHAVHHGVEQSGHEVGRPGPEVAMHTPTLPLERA